MGRNVKGRSLPGDNGDDTKWMYVTGSRRMDAIQIKEARKVVLLYEDDPDQLVLVTAFRSTQTGPFRSRKRRTVRIDKQGRFD